VTTASHLLRFPQLDREIFSHGADSVYQCARKSGVRIVGACGGRGTCGTCTVRVVEGRVEHGPDGAEVRRTRKWLRACQIVPRSDCTIEVAPRSLAPVVRAEVGSEGAETLRLDPAVASAELDVRPATLADNASDADRVLRALAGADKIDLAAARQLSGLLRAGAWRIRAHRRDGEVIGFAAAGSPTLGLAVDLGTTNAAGFLIDLESGRKLATLGIENPQVAWGADVISRINAAAQGAAQAEELRGAAVAAIDALAHDLCRAVGATPSDVVDVAICGNTAMHHLLLGLPVRQLGRAPFVAALCDALDVKARDLGLALARGAYVHLAPNIGGFVGGDHVAALIGSEPDWAAGETSLMMDIGTNTEISLIHRGAILSASCPSGPALEGGHISCGMRAAEGAIERVSLKDGCIEVTAIGDEPPVGLCGSGVIDALATLRQAGILDERGRFVGEHPALHRDGGARVELAPGVSLTQHDVRAVQLAKAAIRTGIDLLLREAGLAEGAIERVVIAGAFGAYIDVAGAIAIGLLPDLPAARFRQVGNAAGLGVRQMLASRRARTRAREIAQRCRYVELSTRKDFQACFLGNIGFKTRSAS
jgi:uncharacterized 2Fe-2S/4Fe-4S cluster protein (DUF4445 family)